MVGQRTLTPPAEVRILVPQPLTKGPHHLGGVLWLTVLDEDENNVRQICRIANLDSRRLPRRGETQGGVESGLVPLIKNTTDFLNILFPTKRSRDLQDANLDRRRLPYKGR